jgi:hypothetical protein
MTPKEKAEELVGKYVSFAKGKILFQLTMESAKQCALIAVDELINIACDVSDYDKSVTKIYWSEVKKEIESL